MALKHSKAKKPVKASAKKVKDSNKQSFLSRLFSPIAKSRAWKFLRRWVIRSPFGGYFVGAWRELRQVNWPKRKTAWKLTMAVFLFSAVFSAFTTALDYGFEKLARQLLLR